MRWNDVPRDIIVYCLAQRSDAQAQLRKWRSDAIASSAVTAFLPRGAERVRRIEIDGSSNFVGCSNRQLPYFASILQTVGKRKCSL